MEAVMTKTECINGLIADLLTSIRSLRHQPLARPQVREAILRVRQLRGLSEALRAKGVR
jgi:hypothetical protein